MIFHQVMEGTSHHITGTVPSTLTDFKIQPPTFLTVPIKNEIPCPRRHDLAPVLVWGWLYGWLKVKLEPQENAK